MLWSDPQTMRLLFAVVGGVGFVAALASTVTGRDETFAAGMGCMVVALIGLALGG